MLHFRRVITPLTGQRRDVTESRSLIEPRTLKGFRDHLPAQALAREKILDIARRVYRSYGFAPIDTPALEYLEILTGCRRLARQARGGGCGGRC